MITPHYDVFMRTLIWYRNDLRTTDHEPLAAAAKNGDTMGIYCFDPRHFEGHKYRFPKTDAIRAPFLLNLWKFFARN